jgi:hypothetical protein
MRRWLLVGVFVLVPEPRAARFPWMHDRVDGLAPSSTNLTTDV